MNKPLISFLLLSYNQEEYINDAIDGAFSQTYSPLEIIISDDCSNDNTYEIIKHRVSQYNGNHIVKINRNDRNMGIAQHFNKLCEMSSGEIIVAAAGDDISLPNRVMRSYEILSENPNSSCVSFNSVMFNSSTQIERNIVSYSNSVSVLNKYDYFRFSDFIIFSGDSRAFKKKIYDFFGPIIYGKDEDSTYFIRSILFGSICFSEEFMVLKRQHNKNVSAPKNKSTYNDKDFLDQPLMDVKIALDNNLITSREALMMQYKIKQSNRLLKDNYFHCKSLLYKLLYDVPLKIIKHIKNRVFV